MHQESAIFSRLLKHSLSLIHTDMQAVNSLFITSKDALSPKDEVMKALVSDPAFLHAALAHAAVDLSNLNDDQPYPEFFYHQSQSISLLKNRVKSPNIAAVLHTTIGAVASLVNVEVPPS